MLGIARRSWISVSVIAFVAAAILIAGLRDSSVHHAKRQGLSAAEESVAKNAALKEVYGSIPGRPGTRVPIATDASSQPIWPENVNRVEAERMTRGEAQKFVSSALNSDDCAVLVVRITGSFEMVTTGPSLPTSSNGAGAAQASSGASNVLSGQVETLVVDAVSGQLLDFGMDPDLNGLPDFTNSTVIWAR